MLHQPLSAREPPLPPRRENGCANAVPLDEQVLNIRDQSCRRRGNGLAVPMYGAQLGDGAWRRRRRQRPSIQSSLIGQLNVLIFTQAVCPTADAQLPRVDSRLSAPCAADAFFVASTRMLLLSFCCEANGSACKESMFDASIRESPLVPFATRGCQCNSLGSVLPLLLAFWYAMPSYMLPYLQPIKPMDSLLTSRALVCIKVLGTSAPTSWTHPSVWGLYSWGPSHHVQRCLRWKLESCNTQQHSSWLVDPHLLDLLLVL
jgi:hypothetical protein